MSLFYAVYYTGLPPSPGMLQKSLLHWCCCCCRVVLSDQQYINASLVQVQLPMLQRPCSYIATQGPLPTTAVDFWRMVFELKVPAIVMLTNVTECGMSKCAEYFPAQPSGHISLPGFKLQVSQGHSSCRRESRGQRCRLCSCWLSSLMLEEDSTSSPGGVRVVQCRAFPQCNCLFRLRGSSLAEQRQGHVACCTTVCLQRQQVAIIGQHGLPWAVLVDSVLGCWFWPRVSCGVVFRTNTRSCTCPHIHARTLAA